MAILANALNQSIAETGTTIFRPSYTPTTFGAIAGRDVNNLFDPERYTAVHRWHQEQGAKFEDVGQWKRPWYFPQQGETMQQAVDREGLAVRNSVGILDASTLGKIDIQGPDAAEFITRMYTNSYLKLAPGKCRYGVMLKEDGMIFDDGVCACLGDNHPASPLRQMAINAPTRTPTGGSADNGRAISSIVNQGIGDASQRLGEPLPPCRLSSVQ